jgi:signal transduction histidine kinase
LSEFFHFAKGNQGNGLGLWICKGIIDKDEGSIRVRSSDKQGSSGTVFSIFLPQDARDALEPPNPLLDKVSL